MKIILLAACTVYVATAHADPLADFKMIVKACADAYASRPESKTYFNEKLAKWVKVKSDKGSVAYDVKKTDSLVSPLTGYVEVTSLTVTSSAADQIATESLDPTFNDIGTGRDVTRANFRFNPDTNQWVLVDGRRSISFKSKQGESYDPNPLVVTMTREKFEKSPDFFAERCLRAGQATLMQ